MTRLFSVLCEWDSLMDYWTDGIFRLRLAVEIQSLLLFILPDLTAWGARRIRGNDVMTNIAAAIRSCLF